MNEDTASHSPVPKSQKVSNLIKSPKKFWLVTGVVGTVVLVGIVLAITLPLVLKKKKTSSSAKQSTGIPTICTTESDQVNVYIQLVTEGNYAVSSSLETMPGAVVQNHGDPVLKICLNPGTGRIPLYSYVDNGPDAANNRWGTSPNAPEGYKIANDGKPIGYIFEQELPGLFPVYESLGEFNSGSTAAGIISHAVNPVLGGHLYATQGALGFSL